MTRTQQVVVAAVVALLYLWFGRKTDTAASDNESPAAPGQTVFRQRLVAVGDLHGDVQNARKVLQMARVVDPASTWIGGNDILVQTGDIVDRGTYALDIYRLMRELRSQASAAGGRVVSVLGNHEYMNAIGDWRYVTQPDIEHSGGSEQRQLQLSAKGWLGQEWLANYSVTALVPLGPYTFSPSLSFTHGSLRPSYPQLAPYPDAINALGHSLLTRALAPPLAPPYPPNPYSGLPAGHTPEEAALYDGGGPLWWRGLAEMQDEATVCGWAKELQRRTGATRFIGGHTPNFERIVDRCNGTVIIIDTGISSAYGGVLSALEVIYTVTAPVSGSASWVEREEISAIYERGKKKIVVTEGVVSMKEPDAPAHVM